MHNTGDPVADTLRTLQLTPIAPSAPTPPPGAALEAPPVVRDIVFRMSEQGDAIGFDLECHDGSTRRMVFPVATLPKLLAGFLWCGSEAAQRAEPPPVDDAMKERLQDGARTATKARLLRIEAVDDVVLEIEVGAALFSVRLPASWAHTLGVSLLDHVAHVEARAKDLA